MIILACIIMEKNGRCVVTAWQRLFMFISECLLCSVCVYRKPSYGWCRSTFIVFHFIVSLCACVHIVTPTMCCTNQLLTATYSVCSVCRDGCLECALLVVHMYFVNYYLHSAIDPYVCYISFFWNLYLIFVTQQKFPPMHSWLIVVSLHVWYVQLIKMAQHVILCLKLFEKC